MAVIGQKLTVIKTNVSIEKLSATRRPTDTVEMLYPRVSKENRTDTLNEIGLRLLKAGFMLQAPQQP
jgi:hypothetical protein